MVPALHPVSALHPVRADWEEVALLDWEEAALLDWEEVALPDWEEVASAMASAVASAVAGVDRRTKLIEQQVSGHPAIPMCPAATAERLVAASLEPGAVVSAQIPTQLLTTHTAGAEGGVRIQVEAAHHSGMMSPTIPR